MLSDLVSVIMPVKNEESFLEDCLQSIVDQSEKNWELIAIDDHSEDKTMAILQLFAKKDHRIKVYPNPGKGIVPALRFAFQKTEGEYVCRMDGDDLMHPDKILLLKQALI